MPVRILRLSDISEDAAVEAAVSALTAGKLIVFPTETVYGLAALDTPECLELIYRAKSRDRGKPVPLFVSGKESLQELGFSVTSAESALAARFWPGPLTLVLDRKGRSEGVRVPDYPIARRITAGCGGILRVTSANQSGEPPALDAEMAAASLGAEVALILDGGRVREGIPSTVVKCSNVGFDILREGAISHASLTGALKTL